MYPSTTQVSCVWVAAVCERDVRKRSVQRDHRRNHQQDIDGGDRQQPEPAEFRQRGQVGVDILIRPDEGVDHDRRSLSIGYF